MAYSLLQAEFWINPLYARFSFKAQLIAAYLISCPHSQGKEDYRSAEEYIAVMFGFDMKTVRRVIQELIDAKFLSPTHRVGWKLIHFFKDEDNAIAINKARKKFSKNMAFYSRDI